MKTEAIMSGMISLHEIKTVKASTEDIPFCGVATGAKSHLVLKIIPVYIQNYNSEKGTLETKLLDVQRKPNETAQTSAQYVHGTSENIILFESVNFSGDNCNTMFGSIACASTHNVFCKTAGFSRR